ncbi:MAG: acyltransferase family protein [Lachnospiraceae bacterium]|jgi:peptidoglycan/LPS O-acetylase OafA/YrhL
MAASMPFSQLSGVNPKKQKKRYIAGLDGFRAVATLMVLGYHLQLPFAAGGLVGVTVFFVLSGFFITNSLLAELEQASTIDLKTFWLKRVRRILPAILTMTVIVVILSAIFNRVLFTKACRDIVSVLLGFNNWWQIYNNVSYFENAGSPSPFTHTWSLAIEAQFYLLFPLLLLLLNRSAHKRVLIPAVTGALAVISFALMWVMFDPSADPSRVYYGTDTRAFSLLCGALLSMAVRSGSAGGEKEKKKESRIPEIVGVFSLAGLLYLGGAVNGYSTFWYHGGQGLASILSAAVIFAVLNSRSILGKVLSIIPLRWIGKRSYGIYLWHYPLILLIRGSGNNPWYLAVLEIVLSMLIASYSYYYIEYPIRRGIIRKKIDLISSQPKTRKGRQALKRAVVQARRTAGIVVSVGIVFILCVAFVPRKNAVENIAELEAQAERANAIKQQKIEQMLETAEDSGETAEAVDIAEAETTAAETETTAGAAVSAEETETTAAETAAADTAMAENAAAGVTEAAGTAETAASETTGAGAAETAAAGTAASAEAAVTTAAGTAGTTASAEAAGAETAAAASVPTAEAGAANAANPEILSSLHLLLIGDSVALGATDEFYAAFPNSISDAAVSRYTTESFAIYDSYVNQLGWNGDGVIFALGTNGPLYNSLTNLRSMLGPDRPFFIFTVRAPGKSWEAPNNAEVYSFVSSTPNTYLIDWYAASEGHDEYFIADHTHLTDAGEKAYVECIRAAVLQVYQ